jgi:ATP-binding cassette, subfamily F, member 3
MLIERYYLRHKEYLPGSSKTTMTDHIRDFDKAHATRWNTLDVSSEARNILNRNIQLEGVFLGSEVNQGEELLTMGNLNFIYGRKYGLVGRNGVGKSTLLRAMADHKIMGIYDHQRILLVDDGTDSLQLAGDATGTANVMEYLLAQHKDRIALHKKLVRMVEDVRDGEHSDAFDSTAYGKIMEQLQHLGDASVEPRALKILSGLGVDANEKMSNLSGGWRHRVALAAALFLEADVLLLDEPTNHLDIPAIVWLEEFLKTVASTVVVVSHDFHFLDAVTDYTVSFEGKQLHYYDGNFSHYVTIKQQKQQKQKRMYLAQEKKRRHMEETISNLQTRAQSSLKGKGFGAIRSRQHQLKHRLGVSLDGVYWKYGLMGPRPEILAPEEAEPFDFEFDTDVSDVPDASGGGETMLLETEDLGFTFEKQHDDDSKMLFSGVNLTLTLSSRIGLVGQNGTGKTTLLRLLSSLTSQPTTGDITRWVGLRTALFEQHIVKKLAQKNTDALHYIKDCHPSISLEAARDVLGSLGLIGIVAESVPICDMSDGQRARVVFAELLVSKPHILFLDEPTSHLDAETSSALAAALVGFEGGIVVASHDRTFLEEVTTERFCMDPWLFGNLTMSLEDYKKAVLAHNQLPGASEVVAPHHHAVPVVEQHDVTRGEKEALATSHVTCRHCQRPHFSHSCPNKAGEPSAGVSFDQTVEARRAALVAHAEEAKKKTPVVLPPTREKAADGNGDWQVSVSKSTKKRIEKQLR